MSERTAKHIEERVIELFPQSRNVMEIVRETGVPRTTLVRILKRNGLAPREFFTFKVTAEQQSLIVEEYTKGKSSNQIAFALGLSRSSIFRVLHNYNITARNRGNSLAPVSTHREQEIVRLWREGKTKTTIARGLRMTGFAVSAALRKAGLEPERRHRRRKQFSMNWKGGKTRSLSYVFVMLDDDSPFVSMRLCNGYVAEHRLVMAQKIGRSLSRFETVHHINGVRSDNRIENLQLRSGNHGKGAAFQCADCGSHNVVAVPIPDPT